MGETPGVGAGERENKADGLVLCGQQTVRVDENAFGVSSDLMTLDQEKEKGVKKDLLHRAPCMAMELGEERTERMGALVEAVSVAKEAEIGEPPAKASPTLVCRKLGAGMVRAPPRVDSQRKTDRLTEHSG